MSNTGRVDKKLFRDDHYLGKPADDEDKIISRRISVMERYPEFFNKTLSCIEVGCGGGATITRIANRFEKSVGIDIYDYSNEFEHQKQKHGAQNCEFRKVDLENETLPEKFDRLVSFEVIEHLKSEDSIAAYFKILNDGGMAAISVPNKWWVFETHGAKLPLLPWNRVPFFSWLPGKIHERYANARIYTAGRITRLFEKHGFTIIDTCYITAPMDVLKEGRLKRFLVKNVFRNDITTVPMLSTSIFLMAQKKFANG
ncbi:MAG: methyltransferase domain-containing protein [Chitinophagaceae bacterium]|nr:methyltransferase domain-containing protein [Chitinophagaceae bacterium]